MDDKVNVLKCELNKEHPDRTLVMHILTQARERDVEGSCDRAEIPYSQVAVLWGAYREVRDHGIKPKHYVKITAAKVLAVTMAFVFLLSTAPAVFGARSVFEILGEWTRDRFSFMFAGSSTPGEDTRNGFASDDPDLQQVYATVSSFGITQPVVPTWIPQEYELQNINIMQINSGTLIDVVLGDRNSTMTLLIKVREQEKVTNYYKEIPDAQIVEISGIRHYILYNELEMSAAWVTNNLECSLSLCGDYQDFKNILYSIYWRNLNEKNS